MPGYSTTLGCPDARADASVHIALPSAFATASTAQRVSYFASSLCSQASLLRQLCSRKHAGHWSLKSIPESELSLMLSVVSPVGTTFFVIGHLITMSGIGWLLKRYFRAAPFSNALSLRKAAVCCLHAKRRTTFAAPGRLVQRAGRDKHNNARFVGCTCYSISAVFARFSGHHGATTLITMKILMANREG
jgi:hypothetical protein